MDKYAVKDAVKRMVKYTHGPTFTPPPVFSREEGRRKTSTRSLVVTFLW